MLSSVNTGTYKEKSADSAYTVGRLAKEVAFIGMLLITLSDFYFPSIGLPVVPMLGTAMFVGVVLAWPRPDTIASRIRRRSTTGVALTLFTVYVTSAIWGLFLFHSGSIKGAVGMGLGTLILTVILYQEENAVFVDTLMQFCTRLLVIHVGFWLLQGAVSLASHNFLDYILPVTGVPTRHGISVEGVDTHVDRYTGLFAEPAIYVTYIYFFVTVRLLRSDLKLRFLDLLAMATIVGSLSITGILLVVYLLVLCAIKSIRNWKSTLVITATVGLLAGAVLQMTDSDVMAILVTRLNAPSSDPSGRIRTVDAVQAFTRLPETAQLFGIGVGNSDILDKISNGVMDILVAFGIVGVCVLVVLFVSLLRQRKIPGLLWLFIIGMLPGGTYFTIQAWWLWIGMMALAGVRHVSTDENEGVGA